MESDNKLEYEKKDFFNQFMKDVERELLKNKTSYVFSEDQLEFLKKRLPIVETKRDECCIYIKLKKEC